MSFISTENYKYLWEAISNNINKELNPEQFINFDVLTTIDHKMYLTGLKRGELKENNLSDNLIVYYLPYKEEKDNPPILSQCGFEDFDGVVFFLFNEFLEKITFAIIPKNKFSVSEEKLKDCLSMNFIPIKKIYEDEGLDEFLSPYYFNIIKNWEEQVGLKSLKDEE